jgi:hypothetical protein
MTTESGGNPRAVNLSDINAQNGTPSVLAGGLAIADGTLILGSLPGQPPRPVLYMALEDSDRRMKERWCPRGDLNPHALLGH